MTLTGATKQETVESFSGPSMRVASPVQPLRNSEIQTVLVCNTEFPSSFIRCERVEEASEASQAVGLSLVANDQVSAW
jgi:hypothetical protein